MMNYIEAIEEFGDGVAAALLEEEYNQFIGGLDGPAAAFYPFDCTDSYIDFVETIGHRKVKVNYEKLYLVEEGI